MVSSQRSEVSGQRSDAGEESGNEKVESRNTKQIRNVESRKQKLISEFKHFSVTLWRFSLTWAQSTTAGAKDGARSSQRATVKSY